MINTKIMAVLMVSLMVFSGLIVLADNTDDLSATVGDGGTYSYTLTYHADQMSNTAAQETQLTVDGMTPISHASGTTTLSAVANEGSWTWNTTTGIGPFNSFYGAFDMTDGNKFVSILNPYDLTKKIDGTSLDDMTKYNIMWVLPTVYWSTDNNDNVTLTNVPGNGTAYAHMIDGKIYQYLAIGVYEGSTKTVGSSTVLTSESGKTPTGNLLRSVFRDYANNNLMDTSLGADAKSMLWNYNQWTLYRLCSFTVMEGFNSQAIVGNGNSFYETTPSTYSDTGLTNSLGPYSGNPGTITSGSGASSYGKDSVRLFIENAWGNLDDFVDGYIGNRTTIVLNSSSTPTDATTGPFTETIEITQALNGYGTAISTSNNTWGIPTSGSTNSQYYTAGTCDLYASDNTHDTPVCTLMVGGHIQDQLNARAFQNGISYSWSGRDDTYTYTNITSRLAFVYGETITPVVSFEINPEGYGSTSMDTVNAPIGTTISTSTNTITLGTSPDATVITATPIEPDVQYTYIFDSWTGIPASGKVTEDLTITANFTQTLNTYTITWVVGETSTEETYDYGATPTHENPTPPDGYYFVGWNPEIATVTGDQTYTAVFSNMTVTFDPGNGTLDGGASKVVVIGQPIGELPECTPPTNYTFDGWYTAATGGTKVTEDTIVTQEASFTLYAHYELVPALQPVKAILDILPILMAVGLILGAVYVFITRPELATGNNLLYAIVGISVAVLMMAVFVIPIIGSAL